MNQVDGRANDISMIKKSGLIFLLSLPLVFLLPSVIYLGNNSIVLYPNEKYAHQYQTFNAGEYSIEDFYFDNTALTFRFRSKDGPGNPYASLVIWLDEDANYQDLSAYDYLEINVIKATPQEVVIFIKTFLDGISKPKREDAFYLRHNEFTLPLLNSPKKHQIPLKKFITPDWWYELLQVPAGLKRPEKFKQAVAVDFQFIKRHAYPVKEQSESFVVKEIALRKSYPLSVLIPACLAGACYLGLGVFWFILKPRPVPRPDPDYKPLPVTNYEDDALACIKEYIETHYNDPHISTGQIGRATGISQARIIELIKKEYHDTCKQVINKIRIAEAKRLLRTTDRRITEIALELGFNDITTFNKFFKKLTGSSPRSYRSNS